MKINFFSCHNSHGDQPKLFCSGIEEFGNGVQNIPMGFGSTATGIWGVNRSWKAWADVLWSGHTPFPLLGHITAGQSHLLPHQCQGRASASELCKGWCLDIKGQMFPWISFREHLKRIWTWLGRKMSFFCLSQPLPEMHSQILAVFGHTAYLPSLISFPESPKHFIRIHNCPWTTGNV